ncbi:MAG: tetratricopeptide repeat protein [Bacteroidales bacterium]|nr:tetratricopeptide repeat protein [Bacteroidales bacterium]
MKDIIIQECPNCGYWCEATSKGALGRFTDTMRGQSDTFGELGGKYLGNLGKFYGKVIGSFTGASEGVFSAIVGDKYQFKCLRCHSTWSTNTDEEDQINVYNHRNRAWTIMEKVHAKLADNNQNELKEYINLLQNELADENCNSTTEAYLHDTLAFVYMKQNEKTKALEHINRSLKLCDDPNTRALKGCIMDEGRSSVDAYAAMKEIIHYKKSESDSFFLSKEGFNQRFRAIQSTYVNRFLEIPQQQRRFVFLVPGNLDEKLDQLPEDLFVLPIGNLPTEMDFVGAPKEQTLYVCHPYKTNLYIPYDRYDVELFRDELEEFCWIMDCLGAKRIEFSDGKSESQSDTSEKSDAVHLGGQYKGIGGTVGASSESQNGLDMQTKELLMKGKTYDRSLTRSPFVPNDTVWLQHNQEWQRCCSSRLDGRLRECSLTLSTASSAAISESTRKKLEVEVDAMVVGVSGGIETSRARSSRNENMYVRRCHVEFYPMSEYKDKPVAFNSSEKAVRPKNDGKSNKRLFWIMGGVIVVLAIGLAITLL